jgi:hypothetical protein
MGGGGYCWEKYSTMLLYFGYMCIQTWMSCSFSGVFRFGKVVFFLI